MDIRIGLFCSGGMSTSMLIPKMLEEAENRGIDIEVNAYPESIISSKVESIDVALLGPQVRFLLSKAKSICTPHSVPVDVINPSDYGLMNGANVLDHALRLLEQ